MSCTFRGGVNVSNKIAMYMSQANEVSNERDESRTPRWPDSATAPGTFHCQGVLGLFGLKGCKGLLFLQQVEWNCAIL